jgi:NTE family protein
MAQKADAVFEGGGVKGIGLVGALQTFEDTGFQWNNVVGTSAGAIVAALVAVGYTASEIREIMTTRVNFRELMDPSTLGRFPWAGPWLSAIFDRGKYRGDFFLNLMRQLIAEKAGKEKVTFKDLILPKEPGDSDEEYHKRFKYKLQVIATDISGSQILVLPYDIAKLGTDPDDLEVALAVRMSMSIPFFFRPVVFGEGDHSNDPHWIMDGGLISTFPIWLFDSAPGQVPPWPTIGFLLWEPGSGEPSYDKIRGPISMTLAIARAMNQALDRKVLETTDLSRIVKIPTGNIESTNFDLTPADRDFLYGNGVASGKEFLDGWSFDQYVVQRVSKELNVSQTG